MNHGIPEEMFARLGKHVMLFIDGEAVRETGMRKRLSSKCRKLIGGVAAFLCALLFVALVLEARVELQPCKNHVAPQDQIALGEKAARQVYLRMPVLPDSSPETRYIASLGRKLAAQAPGYKWPYNYHVVNVADINAFALPGGSIFVNLGTIQAAANEAQLAGVMAHETSHVVLQHSVCNAEKEKRVGLLAGIGQIAAGVALGGAAGELAGEGIGLGAGLGFLKMSRGAERQADLMGVGILYDAGYDPHAMAQFFETIQQKYGKGSAQFLSDHPDPGNRTEYVEKEIATFVPRSNYITDTPAFDQIHQQVTGLRAYTSQEIASGAWKRQSSTQTVSAGVNQQGAEPGSGTTQDLHVSSTMKTFRGSDFSIQIPENWKAFGNANAAMFAPSEGISRSGGGRQTTLVYGVLTDVYKAQQQLPLDQAFDNLVSEVTRDNPGLQPGQTISITAAGTTGRSVHCERPSEKNGGGEHDWIVGFQRNGAIRYFVFVAPTGDFPSMKPAFDNILHSITFQ